MEPSLWTGFVDYLVPMTLNAARRVCTCGFAAALLCGVSACSSSADEDERFVPASQSAVQRMSGGYAVDEDGTLRRPEMDLEVPELDPAALEYSAEGAELAARYFLALTEYAWATGDTIPMRRFFTDECSRCDHMAQTIEDLYRNDGWEEGHLLSVKNVKRVEVISQANVPAETFGVLMTIKQTGGDIYQDHSMNNASNSVYDLALFVNWSNSEWHVTDVAPIDSEE